MKPVQGDKVTLRPSGPEDRRAIFEWLAASDVTASMMGPPTFPELEVVTWEEFCADYSPEFFDGSTPEVEASYIIEVEGEPIGQVNYEIQDKPERFAELDIWMRSEDHTGRGHGPDALQALVGHLSARYGIETFVIRPSERNPRAIRAYEKAGFVRENMSAEEQTERFGAGDYRDSVAMLKHVRR